MDEACGTYGIEETCVEGFGEKNLRYRGGLEKLSTDGRKIFNGYSRNRLGTLSGLFWLRIGISGGLL